MVEIEYGRQNDIPVRYQTTVLGRVFGHLSPRNNDIFTKGRTRYVAGGQETSQRVRRKMSSDTCIRSYFYSILRMSHQYYFLF